ncbi:peptidylprolyl isomerase [Sediminibacterium ginsengisoli]|uniref:peptidylprolyl isomerase n=1 Tax=Sediminibacterium ginsengisoli TaxID=413434 RepID=A0A1T4MFU3_9BACT|nr:peptidylprolyl isomerase [Sediminibacterium ginsengisoli]SJZ65726.1 peptidyl-prolyl cis-trans isomerase A (cyclophilin A) [Sediminibacterium ginsengisoli]
MKKILFIILVSCFACKQKQYSDAGNPMIRITTQFGDIDIELYAKQTPKTVAAFLGYIDSGFYAHSSFYRVLNLQNQPSNAPKTELIQGGIWKTNYEKARQIKGIPHESTKETGIKHTDGTISLARAEPGTATTEFFICIDDQPGLDYGGENAVDKLGYAAFGSVVKGLNVVRKISSQKDRNQYFSPEVPIFEIRRIR